MNVVELDFTNLDAMRTLMKDHTKYDTMLVGHNESGELTTTSINEDHIIHCTYQDNGWIQKSVYWDDGNIEYLYEK